MFVNAIPILMFHYANFRLIFAPTTLAQRATDVTTEAMISRVNVPEDVMDQIVIKFPER